MTSTSVLLILIGIFIIANSQNFVGVFQGNKKLSFQGASPTPAVNAQTGVVTNAAPGQAR